MVLDEAVMCQGVGPNLTAKTDVALGFVQLAGFGLAFLNFQFVETRTQDFHSQFVILVLAAFILALHYDAAGQVRNAYSGFHLVYVLAASASGAECVDSHFLGLDDDIDAIVNFRDDEDGGERSVPARGLVKWRNTNQPVYAAFS